MVIPTVVTLERFLATRGNDAGVQTMKETLREAITTRFINGTTIDINMKELRIATLLDPRYKVLKADQIQNTKDEIVDELIYYESHQTACTLQQNNTDQGNTDIDNPKNESEPDFFKIFDDFATTQETNSSNDDSSDAASPVERPSKKPKKSSRSSYFMSQVENYLSAPNIHQDSNPIEWWKDEAGVKIVSFWQKKIKKKTFNRKKY